MPTVAAGPEEGRDPWDVGLLTCRVRIVVETVTLSTTAMGTWWPGHLVPRHMADRLLYCCPAWETSTAHHAGP